MLAVIFQNSVVVILFTLGILVLIHELGHYLVGVLFRMGVVSFSIGFGPKIASFRRGETEFRIGLIPLGGYVQFIGASPYEKVPEAFKGKELYRRPIWQRALMILAGPVANFLLAAMVFSVIAFKGVPQKPPVVGVVEPGSPAHEAGIQPQDMITQLGDHKITTWEDLVGASQDHASETVMAVIQRSDTVMDVEIRPQDNGKIGIIYGFLSALVTVIPQGAAAQQGLPSGARLRGMEFSASSQPPGVFHQVDRWYEVVDYSNQYLLHHNSSQPLYLHLQYTPPVFEGSPSSTRHQSISLVDEDDQDISSDLKIVSVQVSQLSDPHPALAHTLMDSSPAVRMLAGLGIYSGELMVLGDSKSLSQDRPSPLNDDQLMVGDYVLGMHGQQVSHIYDWLRIQSEHADSQTAPVTVLRDGEVREVVSDQIPRRYQSPEGPEVMYVFGYQVGDPLIFPSPMIQKSDTILSSVLAGSGDALRYSVQIVQSLVGMVLGQVPVKSLGGPILIAQVARESASQGMIPYLTMLALISLNLFLINLIPIPVLDGGQLALLSFEFLRGRQLSRVFVERYQAIGFVLILSLIVLATYNDVSRYWLSVLESLGLG